MADTRLADARRTLAIRKETADQRHDRLQIEVLEKLARLTKTIDGLEPANGNWGRVGNLDYINEQIDRAMEFLVTTPR